jgi:prevent-host-death family protein
VSITTLSSREFSQDASKAKRAARSGPVIITDRGRPAHVLLTFEDYERLSQPSMSLAEAVAGSGDFEFEPPRLDDNLLRPVDFSE